MEGLYSKIIKAGERTYFVDVRQSKRRARFLAITETRPRRDDGRKFSRMKVVIFPGTLDEIRAALEEASAAMNG